MSCNSCGKNRKVVDRQVTSSKVKHKVPLEDQLTVRYLGGAYFHKVASPNGAIYPYGIANYGYSQKGRTLIIHKDDFVEGLFEKLDDEVELDDETELNNETETSNEQVEKSTFSILKK